jgi:uroporphyrinogen decarboxylase
MNSIERVYNAMRRQPVDRLPVGCQPWEATRQRWINEGHLLPSENVHEKLGCDIRGGGWWGSLVNLNRQEEILEETETTVLVRDGNGATTRWNRDRSGTPEHVAFECCDRQSYEEWIAPYIVQTDSRRIPFGQYREERRSAAEDERFLVWHGIGPFEMMAYACGHEHMMYGMADDPEWIAEMAMAYAEFHIRHAEELFAAEGLPNGAMFYEDMGFKQRPFMSPVMYEELIQPAHAWLFDFCHSKDLPVIVHSCGFVEPLLSGMVESGIDCLHAMEVKAGMDLCRIAREYGDRIALYGGIDARTVISNDRAKIEQELREKIPAVLQSGASYLLHTDHSEPPEVDFETMQFFFDCGRKIGQEVM